MNVTNFNIEITESRTISISIFIMSIVLSLINYFKLLFRDDPLLVEDLTLFSETALITSQYDEVNSHT